MPFFLYKENLIVQILFTSQTLILIIPGSTSKYKKSQPLTIAGFTLSLHNQHSKERGFTITRDWDM